MRKAMMPARTAAPTIPAAEMPMMPVVLTPEVEEAAVDVGEAELELEVASTATTRVTVECCEVVPIMVAGSVAVGCCRRETQAHGSEMAGIAGDETYGGSGGQRSGRRRR